jgi:hypothetical protein
MALLFTVTVVQVVPSVLISVLAMPEVMATTAFTVSR